MRIRPARVYSGVMSDGEEVDYSPEEPQGDRKRDRKETSSEEEEALAGQLRQARRLRTEQSASSRSEVASKYEAPRRTLEVLKTTKTFNDYKNTRTFRFLHLFSGKRDVLGKEILRQCHAEGLRAEICALDKERDGGPNMLADQPYQDLVRDASKGDFDASHAGYPCGSFSRVRYVETEGMPGPVRSLQHIYGLPTNTQKQQKEADQGTIMCVRSLNITAEVIQAQRRRGVPEAAALENPPGSETGFEGPSWELPESKQFHEQFDITWVDHNTCAFQQKERVRWFKPGRFAGRMKGLDEIVRPCRCPSGFEHQALRGRERTAAAAEYPRELCEVYAKLLVKVWKTTLNLEWWRWQAEEKEEEVNRLQKAWMVSKKKRLIPRPIDGKDMEQRRYLKRAYEGDDEILAGLPQRVGDSQKVKRELENNLYLGGMRNPGSAVARMNILADAGKDIRRLWQSFVQEQPEALDIAKTNEEVAARWKTALGKLMRAIGEPTVLRDRWSFKSPLDPAMWDAWGRFSKDPEENLAHWARHGVPFTWVFPPVEMEEVVALPPELEEQLDVSNYKSMREDMEAAKGELDRYMEKGFGAAGQRRGCRSIRVGHGLPTGAHQQAEGGTTRSSDETPHHHRHAAIGRQQESKDAGEDHLTQGQRLGEDDPEAVAREKAGPPGGRPRRGAGGGGLERCLLPFRGRGTRAQELPGAGGPCLPGADDLVPGNVVRV